jgi:predicted secreted hydrolase
MPVDPQPVILPRDDAPHHRLTEWWYYTGHLETADGRRFGFEDVIFRAERGAFPVSWASHLAVTEESADQFHFSQRAVIGAAVDRSPAAGGGFDLSIGDGDTAWSMSGGGGRDQLKAALTRTEALAAGTSALGLNVRLVATKPETRHNDTGWIDFGAGGSSYYYSRTKMDAEGTVTVGGDTLNVTGEAWFDHQWGDFISVGGGGWDWFAINLEDNWDLTLSLVRDADGSYPLVYGTLVPPQGLARNLPRTAFTVDVTGHWRSERTGTEYPSAWRITIPSERLEIDLSPTVADQELDTRATTGVVYWEGSQRVLATRDGQPLGGEAYVELTGYAAGR